MEGRDLSVASIMAPTQRSKFKRVFGDDIQRGNYFRKFADVTTSSESEPSRDFGWSTAISPGKQTNFQQVALSTGGEELRLRQRCLE